MPGVAGRSGGHNRKTLRQLKVSGGFRKGRHQGLRDPVAAAGIPVPPKALTGDAAAEWDRMLSLLVPTGALSIVDAPILFQYVTLFAEVEAIALAREETAATISLVEENLHGPDEDREDLLAVVQEITKLRQLAARYTNQARQGRIALKQFLVEFGLTPASRGRVKLAEKKEADPFTEFDDETVQ